VNNSNALPVLAIAVGAVSGGGLFMLIVAVRGLPVKPKSQGPGALERQLRGLFSIRGAVAAVAGILTLVATRWAVAGIGAARLYLALAGRRGRRAQDDGPAGEPGHLDRVAARHDRGRGRP
jgi:hypothetical protein